MSLRGGWLDRWQARDAPLGCLSRSVGPSRFPLSLLAAARRGRPPWRPAELDSGRVAFCRRRSDSYPENWSLLHLPRLIGNVDTLLPVCFFLLINVARKKKREKSPHSLYRKSEQNLSGWLGSTNRRWCWGWWWRWRDEPEDLLASSGGWQLIFPQTLFFFFFF